MFDEDFLKNRKLTKGNDDTLYLRMDEYVPFLEQKIKIEVILTDVIIKDFEKLTLIKETLNTMLTLPSSNLRLIKKEVWRHYHQTISNCDLPEAFSGWDKYNPDKLYGEITPIHIFFDAWYGHSYFNLEYSLPWDEEQGIIFTFSEGEISCSA